MRLAPLLLAIPLLVSLGCSRDDEMNAFSSDLEKLTTDLVSKVEAGKDPAAGADDALKHFADQKPDLEKKFASVGEIRAFQVNDETKTRFESVVQDAALKVCGLKLKHLEATMNNKDLEKKFDKLCEDFGALFNG